MSTTPWASKELRTLRELHEEGKIRPVSIRWARHLCRQGIWHAKKVGGRYYTSEHEFHQWLWKRANTPFKKYSVMNWHKLKGGNPPDPPPWSTF